MKEILNEKAEDLDQLQRLAEMIASRLSMGDWIWFEGAMGAGKSSLIRLILKAWGVSGEIPSPTYLIMMEYECWGRKIYHIDGFRLEGRAADVWDPQALEKGICFVEWPEKTGLPKSRFQWKIEISQMPDSNTRSIRLIFEPFS